MHRPFFFFFGGGRGGHICTLQATRFNFFFQTSTDACYNRMLIPCVWALLHTILKNLNVASVVGLMMCYIKFSIKGNVTSINL